MKVDFVLGCMDTGLLLAPLPLLLLFEEAEFLPASRRHRFPDAGLKILLRFNVVRILWTILVIFHGGLGRFATQIIEVFFLFAQWWTTIHVPRFVKIPIGHSEILNDGTCAGRWFFIHSCNLSLVTTVNHFVDDCHHSNFLLSFLLDRSCLEVRAQLVHLGLIIFHIALANIHRDVFALLDVADVRHCRQRGLSFFFWCLLHDAPFLSFSIVACASGINSAWCERSFVCASRFHEACVSER